MSVNELRLPKNLAEKYENLLNHEQPYVLDGKIEPEDVENPGVFTFTGMLYLPEHKTVRLPCSFQLTEKNFDLPSGIEATSTDLSEKVEKNGLESKSPPRKSFDLPSVTGSNFKDLREKFEKNVHQRKSMEQKNLGLPPSVGQNFKNPSEKVEKNVPESKSSPQKNFDLPSGIGENSKDLGENVEKNIAQENKGQQKNSTNLENLVGDELKKIFEECPNLKENHFTKKFDELNCLHDTYFLRSGNKLRKATKPCSDVAENSHKESEKIECPKKQYDLRTTKISEN